MTSTAEIVSLMKTPENIRCVSVIAHVDHGKSTLVDSLLARAGFISEEDAGQKRAMDTLKAEQDRGITIKSTGISLVFDSPTQDGKRVLVNLIDSPGHVDFSSEVTAALRITDGALLVVDCVEGASVQTETVTRQALAERIRPALHINKVDRAILELQLDAESLYKNLEKNIAAVNNILEAYDTGGPMGSVLVDPLKGNVSFGSGKQGWACTLPQFARALAKRNNSDPNVILKRLWGDHFYDPETKKFSSLPRSSTGKPLQRYVCQVVLDPLIRVFKASLIESAEELQPLWSMLDKIGINVPAEKKNLRGSALLTYVMRRWLPASDALVEMIVDHLPSPQAAQRYRVENLYTGPLDDECARAIRECDPAGPLVMYVSKMVPSADGKRFFSYGRVFAGTIRTGQRVRILGPDYTPGSTTDLFVNKAVQRTVLMMGRRNDAIDECPAGNTVALVGIDQYLLKSGTVTSSDTCHSITPMKFSVSPVVRVAVEPKSPADLPKLVEALKILTKPDPLIVVSTSSTGEHIIAGGGELHLEVVLGDLRTLLGDIPIIVSDPVVEFRETVSAKSSQAVLAKTQNNHNRLYLTAEPLGEELVQAVENKRINPRIQQDSNERAQILVKEFEWDANHAKKIWFFGPEPTFTNVFVDQTVGISYLEELKDGVTAGFQWAAKEGVLCEEPMRGIRFNFVDARLHPDAIHRGGGQTIPAIRRAMYGSQLVAQPRIMEPVFLVEISTTSDAVSGVYALLGRRRGYILSEEPKADMPVTVLKAYLPVQESFGFTSALREATSGKAFPQATFDHYQIIDDDPLVSGTISNKVVTSVRQRKGLPVALPTLDKFHDRL